MEGHQRAPLVLDPRGRPGIHLQPAAVIAENDRHRRPDATDAVLWTADDAIKAAAVQLPNRAVPTFRWGGYLGDASRLPGCTSQADYDEKFADSFPDVAELLRRVDGVYAAGGAANWPLLDHKGYDYRRSSPGDVDLFLILPPDAKAIWAKVREVRDELLSICKEDASKWSEALTPGVFTIVTDHLKIQIILRAFDTVSALLHGFDIPSSCVAYDGVTAYMTFAAAWAHAHRLNIVNPAYRSTTYEFRLEKYFYRGYGLTFPHMAPDALMVPGTVNLPRMVLSVFNADGKHATGTIMLRQVEPPAPLSDYAPEGLYRFVRYDDIELALYNIRQMAIGDCRYIYRVGCGHPFEKFADAPPTLGDILPRELFDAALDNATRRAIDKYGMVDAKLLRRYFQLSDLEVHRFEQAVSAALAVPGTSVDATPALAPFREALVSDYKAAAPRAIPWWIVTDPSRQYTVSLNPRMEDPAMWYGDKVAAGLAAPAVSRTVPLRVAW